MARRPDLGRLWGLGGLWLALALAGSAQTGLTLSSPGADTLVVGPGATVGFGVRAASETARTLGVVAESPDGWSPLLTRRQLRVEPGGGALQLVNVRVPSGAAPGVYSVDVTVSDSSASATVRRLVRVVTVRSVAVELVDVPRYAVAGEAYEGRVVVTNQGNAPAPVTVRVGSSQRFRVDLEADRVEVPPGASAALVLRVETARRGRGSVTDRLRAQILHESAPDSMASGARDDAYAAVEVVPLAGDRPSRETWPLTLSLTSIGHDGTLSPVVGASGTMALDPEGEHRIEAVVESPGAAGSIFSTNGEVFARYEGPSLTAFAGRGRFRNPSLTATEAVGDGAWVEGTVRGTDGIVHLRRSVPPRRLPGAVTRPTDTDVLVGLGRDVEGVGRVTAQTVLGVGRRPGAVATARVETEARGVGIDAEGGLVATGTPVFAVRASRALGPLALRGSVRRTSADQPGRAVSVLGGSAGAYLDAGGVTSSLAWTTRRVGERRGVSADIVGDDRQSAASLAVRWSTTVEDALINVETTGDYQGYYRELLGDVRAHGEVSGRTQVTFLNEQRTRFTAGLEHGRVWDPTTGAERASWGLRLASGYTRPSWSLSWQVGVNAGRGELVAGSPHRITAGTNATWRPTGGLRLRGQARFGHVRIHQLDGGPSYRSANGSAQVEAEVGLPGGLELIGRAYVYGVDGRFENHVLTTLRVPIGMPVPYHVDHPEVVGRIVDQATGAGVEGVLVFLGSDRVVTDETGEFRFQTTEDGGFLVADRASLGADRVPLTDLPLVARPGEPVEIVVGRRVTLRGALRRFEVLGTGARADTSDVEGLPYAVVEARGEGRRARVVADDQGRFVFEDLAAGTYTLRLVRGPVPPRHRLEQETLTVTVDESAEVLWRILPTQRTIQLLNGGTLGNSGGTLGGSPRLGGDPDDGDSDGEDTEAGGDGSEDNTDGGE